MKNNHSAQVDMLSLPEIAAWQIAHPPARPNEKCIADLPAIQRGSVWKIKQIEELWDSIIQGFPIGAFLLAPINSAQDLQTLGTQKAKYQQDGRLPATHHLLDGQQRSNAIALGFLDPWKIKEECKGTLWVDLAPSPTVRDVDYVFRVVTRSHPWGYKRFDPTEPLSASQIREALKAFKEASTDYKDYRPDQIPLTATWPRDAEAPIPLSFLVAEIITAGTTSEHKARLLERIKCLSFWNKTESDWHKAQIGKVINALTEEASPLAIRLERLIDGLESALTTERGYGVPILILPHVANPPAEEHPDENQAEESTRDQVETMFVRINSGGTPLEGEELIYSLIKSHWVNAPEFIANLQHKLAVPSRIALLCARLVLARTDRAQKNIPAMPGVSEFRHLMRRRSNEATNEDRQDFLVDLENFIKNDGVKIFETAHLLLADGTYALPPVLATELAQKAPDVFYLLLRWIERMLEQGLAPLQLDEIKRRKLIGFLTALAWFSPDKGKAVSAVWKDLQEAGGDHLSSFFDQPNFTKTLELTDRGGLRMIPLPSPDLLAKILGIRVLSGAGNYPGIGTPDSTIWENWNRWNRLIGSLPKELADWYKDNVSKQWRSGQAAWEDGLPGIYRQAWQSFLDTLWGNRSVLLYAQRDWLKQWFPGFDPSQPENLEDKNHPWDFDHIHPQKYLRNLKGNSYQKIPAIIWDWHSSIGNLRAWPLELNRADGDTTPTKKLNKDKKDNKISDEEKLYYLTESRNFKSASFINVKNDWSFWQKSSPEEDGFPPNYLAYQESHKARKSLIEAITIRFIALYNEWYKAFEIAKLS